MILSSLILKQGVHRLEAFAFCILTVNDKHTKQSIGVKYKDDICAELCLKLSFESNEYFCNFTESQWF